MLTQQIDDSQTSLPFTGQSAVWLVVALTGYGKQEQLLSVGQLHQMRVHPLEWKVMPGQARWEHGLWATLTELFERLAPHLGKGDCTVISDRPFGCFPMVALCRKFGWHYLLRVNGQHTCARRSRQGQLSPTGPVSRFLAFPGDRFYGSVRLWRDRPIETYLSGSWTQGEKEAVLVISDLPACAEHLTVYRARTTAEVIAPAPTRGTPAGERRLAPAAHHGTQACLTTGVPARPSTLEVANMAACETQKFLRHVPFDDRYGLELFSRAIVNRDQVAWDCIYSQYSTLVLAWLHQDPRAEQLFQRDASLSDSLVNAAFARFAHAVTPLKLKDFNQLAGILGYLRRCARCALYDELRAWRTQHKLEAEGATLEDLEDSSQDPKTPDPAEEVMGSSFAKRLWHLLQYEFVSEEEQMVIYLSFYFSMRPAEIAAEYPHRFSTPADVSRIKRNVMERLRRDEHLQVAIKRLTAA
jgi:hypothetical protein